MVSGNMFDDIYHMNISLDLLLMMDSKWLFWGGTSILYNYFHYIIYATLYWYINMISDFSLSILILDLQMIISTFFILLSTLGWYSIIDACNFKERSF